MFNRVAKTIRNKFHPLWYLRQYKFFRVIQRCFDIPVYVKLHNIDWKVRVRLLRHMSWILNSESYEPEITSLVLAINDVLKPKVFWDIGANIGYYSWLLMSQNKEIEVVLFEPDPDNATLLRDTIEHARLENAQLITKAVFDKDGEVTFIVDDISGMTGEIKELEEGDKLRYVHTHYGLSKVIMVKTVMLDSLRNNLKLPDLIKIDAEGAEEKIIMGGTNLIKEQQPVIIFESLYSTNRIGAVAKLKEFNYDVFNAENMNEDYDQGDNLLALPRHFGSEVRESLAISYDRLKNKRRL